MATRDEVLRFIVQAQGKGELGDLAREIQALGKTGDAAGDDLDGLADELNQLTQVNALIGNFTRLRAGLKETVTELDKARTRLVDLQLEFNKSSEPTKKLSRELERARATVQQLTAEQNKQRAALSATGQALKQAGVDTQKLGSAQRETQQQITNLGDKVRTLADRLRASKQSADQAGAGIKKLGADSREAGNQLQTVQLGLTKIAAAAGAAIAALGGLKLGGQILGDAAELEQSLAEVQAVSGATAEEFGVLSQAAEDAAKRTGIGVTQVVGGLTELARAGLSTQQAIAALGPTLDLAQAGNLDLARAVEIAATTLTQFGLGAEDAERVADVLAQTANRTQSSVEGLGASLRNAAPLARQLGIGFEETASILGVLADAGFRADIAGTALRASFSQLLDPSSKFREELKRLGVTSTDFVTVLGELATRGTDGRDAILALGQEAAPAILALSQKGAPAIRALTQELQNAGGAAASTAEIIRSTLSTAGDRLGQTFRATFSDLVEPFLVPLTEAVDRLRQNVDDFSKSPAFAELRDGLTAAFTEGLAAAEKFVSEIDFDALIASITEFAQATKEAIASFSEDFKNGTSAIGILADGVTVALNGILGLLKLGAANVATFASLVAQAVRVALLALEGLGAEVDTQLATVDEKIASLQATANRFATSAVANFEAVGEKIAGFGDAADKAGPSLERMAKATEAGDKFLAGMAEKAKALAVEIGILAEETQGAEADISELGAESARSLESVSTLVALAAQKYRELRNAVRDGADPATIQRLTGEMNALNRSVTQAEVAARSLGTAIDGVGQETLTTAGAFKELGIQSQQALRATAEQGRQAFQAIANGFAAGEASIEDVSRAFVEYGKRAVAAAAQSDEATRRQVAGMLQQQAAAAGVTSALAEIGITGQAAGDSVADGANRGAQALSKTAQAASGAANELEMTADAAKAAGVATEEAGQSSGAFQAAYAARLASLRSEFGATSEAALALFDLLQQRGLRAVNDMSSAFQRLEDAGKQARIEIEAQQSAALKVANGLDEIAAASDRAAVAAINFGSDASASLDAAQARALELVRAIDEGEQGSLAAGAALSLLDQEGLTQLRASAQAAADNIARIKNEAKSAQEQLAAMNREFQDAADEAAGNQEAVLQRQYEERLRQIEELAKRGGAEAAALAAEARQRAEADHKRQLEQIEERRKAEAAAERERSQRQSSQSSQSGTNGSDGADAPAPRPSSPQPSRPTAGADVSLTINVNVDGSVIGSSRSELAESLARLIGPELEKLVRRGAIDL